MEVKGSNEEELLPILKALHLFLSVNQSKLIVESNSSNACYCLNVSFFYGSLEVSFHFE